MMKQKDNSFPECILFNGLGGAGQRHLRIFTEKCPNLTTIGSRKKGKTPLLNSDFTTNETSSLESKYGIYLYETIEEAYSKKPDLAVISTPTSMHCKNIIEAAEQGVDVFVEKPGAANLDEAKNIIDAVKQNNVRFFISYQRRFNPLVIKAKEILSSNQLGKIMSIQVIVNSHVPDWHPYENFLELYACRKDLGGGVLRTEIHELDFLNWVFGSPLSLKASGGCRGPYKIDVEDSAEILMDYGGYLAQVSLCFMQQKQERRISVYGQDGWLELDILKGTLKLKDISSTLENEYKEPMDNDTLFRRQADFFLNKFSLDDDSYCQALLTNATVVDQCLIQISQ